MTSALSFDVVAAKNRPVSKVITLFKDMLKQMEKEAEEDEEIYEKMACWCETNDKEKTKSIADAEAKIEDLTSAIVVLSKHHGGAMLQELQGNIFQVATTMQRELRKHASLLKGVLTRSQRQIISSFVQAPEDYFDAEPTFKQSYAPQSGEIFGILKQMKESFE